MKMYNLIVRPLLFSLILKKYIGCFELVESIAICFRFVHA